MSWIIIAQIFVKGPLGLKGDKGDVGPTGPSGLSGEKGTRGKRGKRVRYCKRILVIDSIIFQPIGGHNNIGMHL